MGQRNAFGRMAATIDVKPPANDIIERRGKQKLAMAGLPTGSTNYGRSRANSAARHLSNSQSPVRHAVVVDFPSCRGNNGQER